MIKKPFQPIWYLTFLVLIVILLNRSNSLDVQFFDTYYVLDSISIGIGLILFLSMSGFMYWFLRDKKLIRWMTSLHLIVSIGFTLSLLFMIVLEYNLSIDPIMLMLLSVIILSQFVFILNIGIGLIRNRSKLN